jgi:hypothetical protein
MKGVLLWVECPNFPPYGALNWLFGTVRNLVLSRNCTNFALFANFIFFRLRVVILLAYAVVVARAQAIPQPPRVNCLSTPFTPRSGICKDIAMWEVGYGVELDVVSAAVLDDDAAGVLPLLVPDADVLPMLPSPVVVSAPAPAVLEVLPVGQVVLAFCQVRRGRQGYKGLHRPGRKS